MKSMRHSQIPYLLTLLCAVAVVFGRTLLNGFVWDDHALLLGRQVYSNFDLRAIFLSLANDVEYLPIRDLTYALDFAIWGRNAAGFHATNLILYLASALVLYFVTLRLLLRLTNETSSRLLCRTALLITLCYLIHPVQVQALNMIMCRNVLLSGIFFYGALLCFLNTFNDDNRLKLPRYISALLLFICAMFSKGTVIILPLVLLLTLLFDREHRGDRKRYFALAPFFGISVVFFFIFKKIATLAHVTGQLGGGRSLTETVVVALQIPWFYARKLLFPVDLAPEYGATFTTAGVAELAPASLFIMLAIVVVLVCRRKYPLAAFGMGWFLLALLPLLNFFATTPVVADRYLYLPAYGFICAAGGIILAADRHRYLRLGFMLAIMLLAVTSFRANSWWKSDQTLWETAIRKEPTLIKGYTNLGWACFHEGRYERAFDLFRREQALAPESFNLELATGYRLFLQKQYQAAQLQLEKALFKKEDALYPLFLLAKCRAEQGDEAGLAETVQRILLSNEVDSSEYRPQARKLLATLQARFSARLMTLDALPGSAEHAWQRAELQMKWGYYQDALATLHSIATPASDGVKFGQMARASYMTGNYDQAIQFATMSIRSGGDPGSASLLAGRALLKKKAPRAAVEWFRKAVVSTPANPEPLLYLGNACYQSGNRQAAVDTFSMAQEKFPASAWYTGPYLHYLKVERH